MIWRREISLAPVGREVSHLIIHTDSGVHEASMSGFRLIDWDPVVNTAANYLSRLTLREIPHLDVSGLPSFSV
jgi:hypothetical protein